MTQKKCALDQNSVDTEHEIYYNKKRIHIPSLSSVHLCFLFLFLFFFLIFLSVFSVCIRMHPNGKSKGNINTSLASHGIIYVRHSILAPNKMPFESTGLANI